MLSIPSTYYKNNEDYITLTAIRKFMREHPEGKFKTSQPREALLDAILEYGGQNDVQAEIVLDWIDQVLQEGIKDIYLQYAPVSEEMDVLFSTEEGIVKHLSLYTKESKSKHICLNQYNEKYKLISAMYSKDRFGARITFTYCKKLHMHDKKKHSTKAIDYPVIADYFMDSQWLLVRAKPRSNLYQYNPLGFDIEDAESTTTEKEIHEVAVLVGNILGIEKANKHEVSANLKNKMFNLLHSYSNTPIEISCIMDEQAHRIESIAQSIQEMCSVPGFCGIPNSMVADVNEDITNIVEKYLSINWRDKNIFIKDRDAYPVRLSATDEEESKVEQSAAMEEPLQTKAVFFDNKKMIYKSKKCDGVVFQWKRLDPSFAPKDSFAVRISVTSKGQGLFKFSEYTAKEDIENVIFSVIGG